MSIAMINTLVKNKILKPGTNVEVSYTSFGMDGTTFKDVDLFEVLDVNSSKDYKVNSFLLSRKFDGRTIEATSEAIRRIDGMEINRVVESHELEIEEDIISKTENKYKHVNYVGKEVDYTEIICVYANGETKKERFDENGEKVRRGRKRIHPLRES